jgi:hypothetical protein
MNDVTEFLYLFLSVLFLMSLLFLGGIQLG